MTVTYCYNCRRQLSTRINVDSFALCKDCQRIQDNSGYDWDVKEIVLDLTTENKESN